MLKLFIDGPKCQNTRGPKPWYPHFPGSGFLSEWISLYWGNLNGKIKTSFYIVGRILMGKSQWILHSGQNLNREITMDLSIGEKILVGNRDGTLHSRENISGSIAIDFFIMGNI